MSAWEIVKDIGVPFITFFLGFVADHFYKYIRTKQDALASIELKLRDILERSENTSSSRTLLNFDYNLVRTSIIEYCDKYKIPKNIITSDLIDLTLFITSDRNIESKKIEVLFSSILRELKLYKK